MKNMVDYQDHYLKKDVLLLAGVFEKFTSESFKFKKKKIYLIIWAALDWAGIQC